MGIMEKQMETTGIIGIIFNSNSNSDSSNSNNDSNSCIHRD